MPRISFGAVVLVVLALLLAIVPTAAAQTAACSETYVVEKGDWLSKIAQRYLGDAKAYNAILEATNAAAKTDSSFATLTNPAQIEVGQKLCIPAATAVPGRENAGIYTNVGPAADASALIETIVLGPDGQARDSLNYVGKAEIESKGTWEQTGDTITIKWYEQGGKAIAQTNTYTVQNGNLVATAAPNTVYTKTTAEVAYLMGLYTSGRKSADGSETLTALTLYPNGQADLNINRADGSLIIQSGTWTVGPNPDTGAQSVTVNLTTQDGQPMTPATWVFQVRDGNLWATSYDVNTWGTDLIFEKYQPPAEPETPASAMNAMAALTGSYSASLPAADAIGRVIVLDLMADNKATLTTQFIGKGEPIVENGTWAVDGDKVSASLTNAGGGTDKLTFAQQDGQLVLHDPVAAGYGENGLTLTRTPSGKTNSAEFDGVTIQFDEQLAKSAQGDKMAPVPVSVAPALGGAHPPVIRFLFDGQKPDEFFAPRMAQVNVYKTADWEALDPSTAKSVADLKELLASKPVSFTNGIPVLPPLPAAQVFRAQPEYLDFQNGSGIGFITYYAQDASPATADSLFYTFQGLTLDGKYYVTVFYPITTALLPADVDTALGGKSYDDWVKGYDEYLANLVSGLDGLVPAAHTPNLSLIQGLVKSVKVSDTTLQ